MCTCSSPRAGTAVSSGKSSVGLRPACTCLGPSEPRNQCQGLAIILVLGSDPLDEGNEAKGLGRGPKVGIQEGEAFQPPDSSLRWAHGHEQGSGEGVSRLIENKLVVTSGEREGRRGSIGVVHFKKALLWD